MKTTSKSVAFVLARGGSKRLPGKNIKKLCGKPLIEYVIEAAKKANIFEDIVISSDEDEILNIAKQWQCTTIKRPLSLSADESSSEDALLHAVHIYEQSHGKIDNIILLQPTSPLTSALMIERCSRLLEGVDSVMTVVRANKKVQWYGQVTKTGRFISFFDKNLPDDIASIKQYLPSGNLYGVKRDFFITHNKLKNEYSNYAFIVSDCEAIDIDYQSDFEYAEFLISKSRVN